MPAEGWIENCAILALLYDARYALFRTRRAYGSTGVLDIAVNCARGDLQLGGQGSPRHGQGLSAKDLNDLEEAIGAAHRLLTPADGTLSAAVCDKLRRHKPQPMRIGT